MIFIIIFKKIYKINLLYFFHNHVTLLDLFNFIKMSVKPKIHVY